MVVVGCISSYSRGCVRRSGCRSWNSHELPSPDAWVSRMQHQFIYKTYHLKSIEFLLDLLSEHWRKAIASSNLAPAVILPTWPGIMELDSRTKGCISLCNRALRSSRNTLRVATESQCGHEIVLPTKCHRTCSSMTLLLVVRCARRGRIGRFVDVWNLWQLKVGRF